MPWHVESNNPKCSGYAVVKDDDGSIAGCHETEEAAERQLAALYASEESSRPAVEEFAVDASGWDAGRAMRECDSAADYARICAGKRAGDPALRASWALPHHYLSKAPTPNANGVRAALQRLGGTQGLTNAGAARSHLEAHMRTINPDYEASLDAEIDEKGKFRVGVPLEEWTLADSGKAGSAFTVRGYAAVFDALSHDMGGFRTKLDRHSLDDALADPALDVHFVWDHDTRYPLARTKNGTLSLSTDDAGLLMEARVGNYSYAKDLRTALERGDVDQGSIALTIGEDSWNVEDDDSLTRTVMKASGLYDVTVTAQGAFPQTSLAVAYSLVKGAIAEGRLPETAGARLAALHRAGEEPSLEDEGGSGGEREEVATWKRELRNRNAVLRDEVAELIERSKAL